MKESEIDTGDIGVTVKPNTLFGKLIGLFTNNKSHAFYFVRIFGKLYVYEMKGFGLNITLFECHYAKETNWRLVKPNKQFTDAERMKVIDFSNRLNKLIDYDTASLFKHLYFKIFKTFPSERKNDNKYICSELCALMANYVRPFTFALPESVTPEDILKNRNYHLK